MLDLTAIGHTTFAYRSTEKISYKYNPATEKENKKGEKTYTAIRGSAEREISIRWHDDSEGEHLTLWDNTSQVAKFTLTSSKVMLWNPSPAYTEDSDLVAKPTNPNNIPIVSTSLYTFFEGWINSTPFAKYLNQLSREMVYPPKLVKLLLLFIAYLNIRTKTAEKVGELAENIDLMVDKDQVASIFRVLIGQVVGDTPHMKRLYEDAPQYLTLPSTETQEEADPTPNTEENDTINTPAVDVITPDIEEVNPEPQESEPNNPETVDILATSKLEPTENPENLESEDLLLEETDSPE